MDKKSEQQKAAEFKDLGRYIFHQYNRVTGMLAYDPEGLYQDIREQAVKICADEIRAINQAAEEARTALHKEMELVRLQYELQISEAQKATYERIIDMQSTFMTIIANLPVPQEINARVNLQSIADQAQGKANKFEEKDMYLAFNLAVHDIVQDMHRKNAQNLARFSNWAKSKFGAPDFDR